MEQTSMWIQQVLNGDASAMNPLLAAFSKKVWYLILKKIPTQDVEDVYQEVCLAVFSGLNRLQSPDKFMAWVFSLTRRKIHEYYRRNDGVEITAFDETAEPEAESTAAPQAQEHLLRLKDLQRNIQRLATPYRDTAIYHFVLGLPYREVAGVMLCNENTAKARITRARTMLQEAMHGGVALCG